MNLSQAVHKAWFHVATAVVFILGMALGYKYAGGMDFVQGWGGGFAAVIATFFLVFKSQGYWCWMVVNAGLWTYLFFHVSLPMLAYLQVSFLIFASYGAIQWALHKRRIGINFRFRTDIVGCVLALGLFIVSVLVYWNQPGYRGSIWWWVEFLSVLTSVLAIWGDAFRYRANWIAWSVSNCFSAPLFYHGALWGPFWTIFLYQALNIWGWVVWSREQKAMEGSAIELEDDRGIVALEQQGVVDLKRALHAAGNIRRAEAS